MRLKAKTELGFLPLFKTVLLRYAMADKRDLRRYLENTWLYSYALLFFRSDGVKVCSFVWIIVHAQGKPVTSYCT